MPKATQGLAGEALRIASLFVVLGLVTAAIGLRTIVRFLRDIGLLPPKPEPFAT
ncbi:hypothetical protein BH09PSE1_BH09PSE1_08050 [soil metagenome]